MSWEFFKILFNKSYLILRTSNLKIIILIISNLVLKLYYFNNKIFKINALDIGSWSVLSVYSQSDLIACSHLISFVRSSSNYSLLMSLCSQGDDQKITYVGTWKYFKTLLVDVAQPCDDMLLYCSFGSRKELCSMTFKSILTDGGLCCTFNALDPSFLFRNYTDDVRLEPVQANSVYEAIDWTPERGYAKKLPEYYYPRTSGGTGSRMGLTVVLNASTAEYYCTKSMSNGFKVIGNQCFTDNRLNLLTLSTGPSA